MLYFVCFIFWYSVIFYYFCNDFIVDLFTENKEIVIIIIIIIVIIICTTVLLQLWFSRFFLLHHCIIAIMNWLIVSIETLSYCCYVSTRSFCRKTISLVLKFGWFLVFRQRLIAFIIWAICSLAPLLLQLWFS